MQSKEIIAVKASLSVEKSLWPANHVVSATLDATERSQFAGHGIAVAPPLSNAFTKQTTLTLQVVMCA